MHRTARQSAILTEVTNAGSCSVADLARQLDVSGETIRRDIKRMASQGLLRKVHGGATLPGPLHEASFEQRMSENAAAKEAIARAAAAHVADGETLSFDTGTTTACVARALAGRRGLTVVTNSLDIARVMAGTNRVFMAGGELHAELGAGLGPVAVDFVSQFRVRTAFLSAGAIDAEDGLTDFEMDEALFSRALIGAAERVIVVADHSKFGKHALVRACEIEAIDMLITDAPPPPALAKKLDEAGVIVEVAG
ncbi:MAG: DeoR/GlpR family DNA-binding transcription regulator [Alphaproteobacteria bacterium]|nr:DeoR/GlpR family DNA-binding transcription regulator [Alphaproteobacteria bacterium]